MKKILLVIISFISLIINGNSQTCISNAEIITIDSVLCSGDTTTLSFTAMQLDSITITTPVLNNNGQDGNMFDITATNTIRIKYFEGNIANTPNTTTQYYVYYKTGSHVGFETNSAAWTMLAGPINFDPNAPSTFTRIPYDLNLVIPAGQTYAFYLTNTSAATNNNRYHNGTATGTPLASNADLTIFEGTGGAYPFGTFFNARPWEGNIIYDYVISYLWNNGATASSIQVSPTLDSNYSCIASVPGCSVEDTIFIQVNPNPVVSLGNDTSLCTGDSIILDAGNPGSFYLWNNAFATQTITTNSAGSPSVLVTDVNGCSNSDTINISLLPLPIVGFSVTPNDTICEGTSITLSGTGAATYSWSGGITDGALFTPSGSGPFEVMGVNAFGCYSYDTAQITVNPLPIVNLGADIVLPSPPVLLDAGSGFASYLWNTSQTTQTISVTTTGNYIVTVTDINGCGTDSDTIHVAFTAGIQNIDGSIGIIQLYPVPADDFINLNIQNFETENMLISIIDLEGNVEKTFTPFAVNGNFLQTYDLTTLGSGMYIMQIQANGQINRVRFVKK